MVTIRRIGFIVLALAIMLGGLGLSASSAQAASSCTQWYTVRYGDTLHKIGVWYGVSWTYLAKINNISNPNKIYAGQVICVSTTGKPPAPKPPVVTTIPTFSIYSVVRNQEVTIYTHNFPPNLKFNVYMGPMHTKAIGGYYVASFNSGKGGSFSAGPFVIPAALKGSYQIAIRAENSWGGYYAYNWFYNTTAVDP
jgi:LysM domain